MFWKTGILLCLMAIVGCGSGGGNPQEAAAVAAIVRLSGTVEYDEKSPEKSVLKVYLNGTAVKDEDLVVLEKLTKVQGLFLGKTKISDAGLQHIQGKTSLLALGLNSTEVTDAGLKHLGGLTSLKTLNLQETKVTVTGIADLRRSLPGLTVAK